MWPLLLRPPVRGSGSRSDFSGVVDVIPSKSETERNRVAGVTGLTCRMPISALEHLDRVAFFQSDERLLPRRPTTDVATVALALGAHDQRPHVRHRDLEERLDRRAHLRLRGVGSHPERVLLAGLIGRRGLLGDHWPHDQRVLLRHPRPPSSLPPRRGPPAPCPRRPPRDSHTPCPPRPPSRPPP